MGRLILLASIMVATIAAKAQTYPTVEEERQILIEFYKATDGDNWKNNENWCSDKPLDEWYGVYICTSSYQEYFDNPDSRGHIMGIDLYNNQLKGTIPSSIARLAALTELGLSTNQLTGEIPVEITQMKRLFRLHLDHNQLSGAIPADMGNMPKLASCNLSNNRLTGEIPASFGNMATVGNGGDAGYDLLMAPSCLDLSYNQLTGNIPTSFAKLLDRVNKRTAGYPWPLLNTAASAPNVAASLAKSPASNPLAGTRAAANYDFSRSIINETTADIWKEYRREMICPFTYVFEIHGNNLSGVIPNEIASHPKWNTYAGWMALNQNPGYGFDIASVKLSVPDDVQCMAEDGSTFNRQSFQSHSYTLFINEDALYGGDIRLSYDRLATLSRKYGPKGFHICYIGASHYYDSFHEGYDTYGFGNIDRSHFTFVVNGNNANPKYSWYSARYEETFGELNYNTLFVFDQAAKLVFHVMNGGASQTAHLDALEAFLESKFGVCEEVFPLTTTEIKTSHIIFSDMLDGQMDLSNTTVGNVYFRLDATEGNRYDAERKGVVITSILPGGDIVQWRDGRYDFQPGNDVTLERFNGIMIPVNEPGLYSVEIEGDCKGRNVLTAELGENGGKVGQLQQNDESSYWGKKIDYVTYVSKPEYLSIFATDIDYSGFQPMPGDENSATVLSVKLKKTKVTSGSSGASIAPVNSDILTFSEDIDENTDLSNTVIDNTFITLNTKNGDGYNAADGGIVLNSTMMPEQMSAVVNAQVGDAAVKENYNGIIFQVAAGSGTVTIDAQTIGSHVLNVQVGKGQSTQAIKAERGTVEVSYNVSEPTYVYLYATTGGTQTVARQRAAAAENSVLLYGYKVTGGSSSIYAMSNRTAYDIYTLQGHKIRSGATTLQGLPKGLYIINGRKVVIK